MKKIILFTLLCIKIQAGRPPHTVYQEPQRPCLETCIFDYGIPPLPPEELQGEACNNYCKQMLKLFISTKCFDCCLYIKSMVNEHQQIRSRLFPVRTVKPLNHFPYQKLMPHNNNNPKLASDFVTPNNFRCTNNIIFVKNTTKKYKREIHHKPTTTKKPSWSFKRQTKHRFYNTIIKPDTKKRTLEQYKAHVHGHHPRHTSIEAKTLLLKTNSTQTEEWHTCELSNLKNYER